MVDEVIVVGKDNSRFSESGMRFFISEARLAFGKLKQAFDIALILHYFDLEYYIRIESDISGYTIEGILN